MHEVFRALGIRKNRVEHLSILRHGVTMRREIVMPGKHGMVDLMLDLKEEEIREETIPVHRLQGHTTTKQIRDRGETPTLVVHVGQINETTKIFLPTY